MVKASLTFLSVLFFAYQINAAVGDRALSELRDPNVYAAVQACRLTTGFCATKYETRAGHTNHVGKCHYVNMAMDIYGSEQCLNWFARCLRALPSPIMYCYKNWGVFAKIARIRNPQACDHKAHQKHLHIQPTSSCADEYEAFRKTSGGKRHM